ncbi:endonuclease/exonuclease/phosphatase family protein [Epilithonimonas hungarica]|uniref:Endonuclease/Exonuclease/phosphatase family protein n=1 Tax=Epilithonimonas hungarica TaxID=454006 RepID=A0A1G7FID4_9FLAO|nr:endonuclease/exonuclease/phosphatase family protein [Epilithonimonas hungarica]SDE75587.1 Endonuclease/Exonuclease/phosphatase family protein [Epilithonimonas hungarica]
MGILRSILTALHLAVIVLLFGTIMNAYIPPRVFGFLNLLSLGFPLLIIADVLLLIFWIFSWRKRAVVFLILSLFFIIPTRRWINYTPTKKEVPNLKLISFNGKFGKFGDDEIYDYLNQQKPDVVFFQEYDNKKPLDGFGYFENSKPITKIQSKFPIIESGPIKTDANNGVCMFADIKVNNKIIRFVNVYMEPFFLDKKMVKPTNDMDKNEEKARKVLHMLIPTFKKHQTQIDQIKDFINDSPYPVIVAGDFNAVPNSYEYYKVSEDLQDVFLKVGRGSGTSFHDFKFPLKIDHVFASESITAINYKVDRSVRISDHFPVIAEFYIE